MRVLLTCLVTGKGTRKHQWNYITLVVPLYCCDVDNVLFLFVCLFYLVVFCLFVCWGFFLSVCVWGGGGGGFLNCGAVLV